MVLLILLLSACQQDGDPKQLLSEMPGMESRTHLVAVTLAKV
ncbi:hypothetical protein [Sodalis-like endosymbiont of Proechinophthirus fluctus]|nr:hypothetical protein [Sodalis-like endosymbiont of Proechinophthirus fluctus]